MENIFEKISPAEEKPEKKSEPSMDRRKFMELSIGLLAGTGAIASANYPKKTSKLIEVMSTFFQRKNNKQNEFVENSKKESTISNTQSTEIEEDVPVIEAEKSKELVANTPQEIAEKVLEKYNELFEKGDFVPNEIFSDNFFIATQLQESGYNSKAESSAGAFGVMQTMPITIKEVVRMLDVWKRKEGIGFACKKYDDMTSADVQEIKNLIQEDNNYGRAFGKLYFAGLYKIHKIGEKDFEKGDTKEAQKKLLASYNWNPKDFKKYENREKAWPKESRNYYKRIFRNMEYLELVKAKTKESQIKSNPNYISMRIVQNMNAYRKLNSNDELFEKLLDKYIENLKLSESSRYRKLRDHEIDEVINLTKGQLMRTYLAKVG